MCTTLTPIVLPAQRDLPVARVALLCEHNRPVCLTMYSVAAFKAALQHLSTHPLIAQQYDMSERTCAAHLRDVKRQAAEYGLPTDPTPLDVQLHPMLEMVKRHMLEQNMNNPRITLGGLYTAIEHETHPQRLIALFGRDPQTNQPLCALSRFNENGSPPPVVVAGPFYSIRMLRFCMSLTACDERFANARVQDFALLSVGCLTAMLQNTPLSLPYEHTTDALALIGLEKRFGVSELLDEYCHYHPPLG